MDNEEIPVLEETPDLEEKTPEVIEETTETAPQTAADDAPEIQEAPKEEYAVTEEKKETGEQELLLKQVLEEASQQKKISERVAGEVREMHRLYHNEFAGRLRTMQEELEKYHDIDRGRAFDDILREVARIYCDNYDLLNASDDPKIKKRIKYFFMDIQQLLEANGVMLQKSEPGSKRNNRFCQIVNRIETDVAEENDTVAKSHGPGFYTEKRPLIKEMVDIYVYQAPTASATNTEEKGTENNG